MSNLLTNDCVIIKRGELEGLKEELRTLKETKDISIRIRISTGAYEVYFKKDDWTAYRTGKFIEDYQSEIDMYVPILHKSNGTLYSSIRNIINSVKSKILFEVEGKLKEHIKEVTVIKEVPAKSWIRKIFG